MRTIRPRDHEITVGLAGPHDLLERIVLAAGLPGQAGYGAGDQARRLVLAAYRNEQQAPQKVARLAPAPHAWLFASRVPLEYTRQAGLLAVAGPAVPVELGQLALQDALTAARGSGAGVARASFDTVSPADVERALVTLGETAAGAHVLAEIAGPAAIASYHARLRRAGQTTAAFTGLDEVARRLRTAGVPVFTVRPAESAITAALRLATLLAWRQALSQAQLTVVVVDVPELSQGPAGPLSRHGREELRHAVHGELLRQAHQAGAVVIPAGEHDFLVLGTAGSLPGSEDVPPFAAAAAAALGIGLESGAGTGSTAREAELQARQRLRPVSPAAAAGPAQLAAGAAAAKPAPAGDPAERSARRRGLVQQPASAASRRGSSVSRLRSLETLARLAQNLAAGASPVVDAELTGQLLSVTPRTARRQLRALADEGLALALPPGRTQHPGRPRQSYRLVVEKLDRTAAG